MSQLTIEYNSKHLVFHSRLLQGARSIGEIDDILISSFFNEKLEDDFFFQDTSLQQQIFQVRVLSGFWNLFEKEKLNGYLPQYLQPVSANELTFYAGSFNPWHEGHSECVRQYSDENLIIMPDVSPWKEGNINLTPFEIIKNIPKVAHHYYGFLTKSETNPTVDWISKVNSEKKNLLMGDDSFLNLHKWKDADKLLKELNKIIVIPRQGIESEIESQKQKLLDINSELIIERKENHQHERVSSTQLRKG